MKELKDDWGSGDPLEYCIYKLVFLQRVGTDLPFPLDVSIWDDTITTQTNFDK